MLIRTDRYTGHLPADIASHSHVTVWDNALQPVFSCHGLEDDQDAVKEYGHTAIDAGNYPIGVRQEGAMTGKYYKRFPEWFEGMLWVRDVPNYDWIYIHILNNLDETLGCLGVGLQADLVNHTIMQSRKAFYALYMLVIQDALDGNLRIQYNNRTSSNPAD